MLIEIKSNAHTDFSSRGRREGELAVRIVADKCWIFVTNDCGMNCNEFTSILVSFLFIFLMLA